MKFGRFTVFNVIGGLLWVTLFVLLGFFLGGIPDVQDNFELIIIAIVVISFAPTIGGAIRARLNRRKKRLTQDPPPQDPPQDQTQDPPND
jgi:membrane-associated protein